MSKKINATTNATTIETASTTMTNNNQEGKTMKKATTSATTSAIMSAQEFKQKSYDAYLSYVAFIDGKKSAADTVTDLSPIMTAYGFTLTIDNLGNLLTVKMTSFGKD